MAHESFESTEERLLALLEKETNEDARKLGWEALNLYFKRDITMAKVGSVPSWFQPAGFIVGLLTLLFFMGIVGASIFGFVVPESQKFPVLIVFALGCAFSGSFLTGTASASGQLPFFGDKNPLAISATGGIAILVIVLVLGYYIYIK